MCQFLSLVSDGQGRIMYFDWKLREKFLRGALGVESPDSHTSIASYFGFGGVKEDTLNKYEYNPLTGAFKIDQLNAANDDREVVRKFCEKLDFREIVPQLIIKPIVNPLSIKRESKNVTKKEIRLLKEWALVRASVRASVWVSIWASIEDSVWDSVGDSVGDSVRAYIGSFFTLPEWKYIQQKKGGYPFQSLVDLWERGLVPSFSDENWRLHAGEKVSIVFEISDKELRLFGN